MNYDTVLIMASQMCCFAIGWMWGCTYKERRIIDKERTNG